MRERYVPFQRRELQYFQFLHSLTQFMNSKLNNTQETYNNLTPVAFAQKYKSQLRQVKGGALCFWGHWFGRPYDNFHQITSVDFDTVSNTLTICFSEKEMLTVSNPQQIKEYKNRLEINNADSVHWQWYYYGKTIEPSNLFYYDIHCNDNKLKGTTNANWYKENWSDLTISRPAVLLG